MTPSELDQLADYAEGLLEGTPDAETVAARIATDQEWADAYRQLTAVLPDLSAELAALPEIPLPPDVAAELDRALAAEGPYRSESQEPADDPAGTPAAPDELGRLRAERAGHERAERAGRDRAARRWRVAGGWVAAAAVVGALCVGVGQLVSDSSDNDDSGEQTASAAKDSGSEAMSAPAAPPPYARVSGTDYSTADLGPQAVAAQRVETSATRSTQSSAPGPASPAVPPALRRLLGPTDLRDCLVALGLATQPLGVDYATLDGTPAIVVVVQGTDPATVTVVAAGAGCGIGGEGDERARTTTAR